MLKQTSAPFTLEQVIALNAYQRRGAFHPFTCGNPKTPHGPGVVLLATLDGFRCPQCTYVQKWTYEFMTRAACEMCGDDGALDLTDDLRLYCQHCKAA